MLQRLAKFLPRNALTWEAGQPLITYLGKQIYTFWHKPRIHAPRVAATKIRIRCNLKAKSTTPRYKSDCKRDSNCQFGTETIDGFLCTAIVGGGIWWAVDTCGRKYQLLRRAGQEWHAKYEHEQSMLKTPKKLQSHTSGALDYKGMDRDESEILRMGKWAWILQRASENEQEERRRER